MLFYLAVAKFSFGSSKILYVWTQRRLWLHWIVNKSQCMRLQTIRLQIIILWKYVAFFIHIIISFWFKLSGTYSVPFAIQFIRYDLWRQSPDCPCSDIILFSWTFFFLFQFVCLVSILFHSLSSRSLNRPTGRSTEYRIIFLFFFIITCCCSFHEFNHNYLKRI